MNAAAQLEGATDRRRRTQRKLLHSPSSLPSLSLPPPLFS